MSTTDENYLTAREADWNAAIEKAAQEVECVDWILPLQPEKRVNDFAREAVRIVIGQCARSVRALAHKPR